MFVACKSQVVIHEIGHAIGFSHEQSRTGRDNFVRILFDNIQQGREGNFGIRNTNNFGVEYDYLSIMHYSPAVSILTEWSYNIILFRNCRF